MLRRRIERIILLVLGTVCLVMLGARGLKTSLADADRLYSEKSYADALKAYESLQSDHSVPDSRKDDIAYRIAVSLGKTQQWDRSLAASLDFVKTHRGTVWEPRGLYWLGRLYLAVPHQGYRIGKRIYRGNDMPKDPAGADAPERVELSAQDSQNALDALEAARVLFEPFRAPADTRAEEVQLDFDLARELSHSYALSHWAQSKWSAPDAPEWRLDLTRTYDLKWPAPKRIMYLYAQIDELAKPLAEGAHLRALGLFAKSLWLRLYQNLMNSYAVSYLANGQGVRIPYPYSDDHPEQPLLALLERYPNDPIRDQAQYTIALWQQQAGQFSAAVRQLRSIIDDRPMSKWIPDARRDIEQITNQQVSISSAGFQMAGRSPMLQVGFRNIGKVRLRAFKVKLEDGLRFAQARKNPNLALNQYEDLFDGLDGLEQRFGNPTASWDLDTKDNGEYRPGTETVTAPFSAAGAYIVEASGPAVRSATVLLLSDLSIVQKTSRDGGLFFVVDAHTGSPVPRANVVAKQFWYEGNSQHCEFTTGSTRAQGLLTVPLLRGPGRSSFRIQAAAAIDGRYALTDNLYNNDYNDNPDLFKVYSVTDRSVYRPTQHVYYRQLVMRRDQGELKPAANVAVHIEVRDSQGKTVHLNDAKTSEFGSVKGEFDLSHSVPLGEYNIVVTVPSIEQSGTQYGGNRFRVEEYKKPEFEVTVTPASSRVRLGQPTSATVHAGYYFGGPVANAHVTYRIYRNYWTQSYRFPRPFDFLYNFSYNGDYNTYYRNGPVIAQGEAETDAQGDAKIELATKSDPAAQSDFAFAIDADVQDASRRVISGSGTVKATRHDVAVFMDFPHGYASKGDRVDVEVMTLNPSDQQVQAAGKARVYREPQANETKETIVYEEPLKTDRNGRGFIHWKDVPSGRFRVAFETRDTAEQDVSGAINVWIDGPELAAGRFQFRDLAILVENPYYEQDQSAKVLLVAPEPGTTVLLTREANNQVISKEVVTIAGRSMEITVPLSRKDVPNVFLSAVAIREGQAFQATQELFVPPVHQLANVSVVADKKQYQPGEKAHLQLTAVDWQGRPLRTELSLGVTDAALNYVQAGYAPDIRTYYYGDRRSISNQMSNSLSMSMAPRIEDSQPRGQYPVHEWILPEGMGQLPDWPGVERQSWYYLNGYAFYNTYRYRSHGGFGGGFGGVEFGRDAAKDDFGDRSEMAMGSPAGGRGGSGGFLMKAESAARAAMEPVNAEKPSGQDLASPQVRSHFADTAFWTSTVVTDAQGKAAVEVAWPDNLTQWNAHAVGTTRTAQVGTGSVSIRTKKDVIVRLQAPRFFVERDTMLLTANVQNYLPQAARMRVSLALADDTAEIVPASHLKTVRQSSTVTADRPELWVDVPKDGERRIDWTVHVRHEGSLQVRMSARAPGAADAAEMIFPVLVHGVERATAQSGVLHDRSEARVAIRLPRDRKAGSSELLVNLNPSLATIMLDALPYLNDYPYGCVEQTMSRFLPSVIVAQTLKESGYDLELLGKRARLLRERAVGVGRKEAYQNSPYTYPEGRPGVLRTTALARTASNPVFDTAILHSMTSEGLARLKEYQHADGGWGWWPQDTSDPVMTAYVLYGLQLARKAGSAVEPGVIDRGLKFLSGRFLEDDNFHRMAYEARVLAMDDRYRASIRPLVAGRLFTNRERLSAYSKALLALALHGVGENEKAEVLLRNIQTTARLDPQNGTVSWGASDRYWWHWYNNRVETNATVLQAYIAIDPKSPMPAMLVKWLANNRRANAWSDTRATAMAVYSLADYANETKELAADYTVTLDLGGRIRRTYTVNHDNALLFDNEFVVPDELLRTGDQTLTISERGRGACYYSAYTRCFSLEDPIPAAGNEISVVRKYFKLVMNTASGKPVYRPIKTDRPNPFLLGQYELLDQGGGWTQEIGGEDGPRYDRVALKDGETVESGDLIEVELRLESKNDYEYVAFEDMKPAGCEAVALRSGGRMGLGVYSNMELRDQKVAFFIAHMPQGTRTLTYRLRAEIPGKFHALPTNGYAMYAPDIRCLSNEMHLNVRDRAVAHSEPVAVAKPLL